MFFRCLHTSHDTLSHRADALVTNQSETIFITGSATADRDMDKGGFGNGYSDDVVVVTGMNAIPSGDGLLTVDGDAKLSEFNRHMQVMCKKIQRYSSWLDHQHSNSFVPDASSIQSAVTTSHSPPPLLPSPSSSSDHTPPKQPSASAQDPIAYWSNKEFTLLVERRRALVGAYDDDDTDRADLSDAPFQTQVNYMRWLCAKLVTGIFYKHSHIYSHQSLCIRRLTV